MKEILWFLRIPGWAAWGWSYQEYEMKELQRKMESPEPKPQKTSGTFTCWHSNHQKLREIHHFLRISGYQVGPLELGAPRSMENERIPMGKWKTRNPNLQKLKESLKFETQTFENSKANPSLSEDIRPSGYQDIRLGRWSWELPGLWKMKEFLEILDSGAPILKNCQKIYMWEFKP